MKRTIASALAILSCLLICVMIIYADPGDPAPPPDSSYVIPPPDVVGTTGQDTICDTCPQSPDPPWIDPGQ